MQSQVDQDRSEPATPYKLAQARKKGQVARSADAVAAAVFCAAAGYLALKGQATLEHLLRIDRALFAYASTEHGSRLLVHAAFSALTDALVLVTPLLLTLMAVAAIANVAQTGVVASAGALAPDWTRLNPAKGLARFASLRTLFDAARALAKLAALAGVAYWAALDLASHAFRLAGADTPTYLRSVIDEVASAGLKVAVALVVVAALDLLYTRHEFGRNMRMSRRELRDEVKQREGDPRIRSRLRELRREMLRRSQAVSRTRQADLVVTNPTHYAVALAYRHGEMAAPRIVAKGAGTLALAMRTMAFRHAVPVVPRPSLARALYLQTDIDTELPTGFYREVAQLMVWTLALRRERASAEAAAT